MEPAVLRYDDRGAGKTIVLVPGGLTGLAFVDTASGASCRQLPSDADPAHPQRARVGRQSGRPG